MIKWGNLENPLSLKILKGPYFAGNPLKGKQAFE